MVSTEPEAENLTPFELASRILTQHGADIVARRILNLYKDNLESGMVITGFRTIEELLLFKERVPRTEVVLVHSSERTRYERYIQRARPGSGLSLDEFRTLDDRQSSFGLLDVADDLADTKITNEGTLEDYFLQIDTVIQDAEASSVLGVSKDVHPRHQLIKNQLYRCLVILDREGRPMSTDEIEEASKAMRGAMGGPIRHNNANKVLKRVPALAQRFEGEGDRVRYQLTNSGRAYIRLATAQAESDRKRRSG
jgi:hypothetical protein